MSDVTSEPSSFGADLPETLWKEFAAVVGEMQNLIFNDPAVGTDALKLEGLRYLTRLLAAAIPLTIEAADPSFPYLHRVVSPYVQWGLPSPDCLYHMANVRGDGVYRLRGQRGSSRTFDVETRVGHIADFSGWKLYDRRTDFAVDASGSVDVVLSATERDGNWIRLPDGPATVIIREYHYDWSGEESARLHLEREGVVYPPEPLPSAASADRFRLLTRWLRELPRVFRSSADAHYSVDPGTLAFSSIDYGWTDAYYGRGHFRCGPDQAVILEMNPPTAQYWSVQLGSHFWESLDWHLRQSSLNGWQAVLDADGAFRAVICHADPGVPNWLDPGGREVGLIAARYYKSLDLPVPTLRTVPFQELRCHLPRSTPEVTLQERQRSLAERALSMWRLQLS
jgi:hypothetical protein